ncbi:hypothetical protein G6011_02936 [Alternaria panax]|uniref:Uncharacterized protein n=1 Tax=Alternaria panax TaxID=48097 RepID=A0AAD4FBH1_9PLEO|nr:hypothetical protein G6011_02936 [Alternaria panax]
MSTIVSIDRLPFRSEPFYILTEYYLNEDDIEDIYTQAGGGTDARVVFKTHKVAKKFTDDFDNYHFGQTGQKTGTRLCEEPKAELPKGLTNRLSDFLHARDNHILSRTVEITGFPTNHTLRNLNQLLEPLKDKNLLYHSNDAHIESDGYFYIGPRLIIHVESPKPGVALVQLETPDKAVEIVHRFAGTYWKNATLNARCVPDEEMGDLLMKEPGGPGEKNVMLFITGIKSGTTSTEVREIFEDFPVCDVNLPPGGKNFQRSQRTVIRYV